MQQAVLPRVDLDMRYQGEAIVADEPAHGWRRLLQHVALLLLLCAFWGLIVYVAISSALP